MTKEDLRDMYELYANISWRDEQGKPTLDYIEYLEDNLLSYLVK